MEHLCQGCINMLKENWNYTANEIEVVIVSQAQCDNTFDKHGHMNLDKKLKYPKNLKVITIKKEEQHG